MRPFNIGHLKIGGLYTRPLVSSKTSLGLPILILSLLSFHLVSISVVGDEVQSDGIQVDGLEQDSSESAGTPSVKDKSYISPKLKPDGIFLYENFDDEQQFKTKWIQSADPKYTGTWQVNSGPDRPHADLQLLLPQKANHYAISSKFGEPFKFSDGKPLIVQYEVQFREGLDCGGAYMKLLRNSAISDLNKLTDKTPFTIMFGPDKCGSEAKLHFIVQYLNPKTHEYEEKHWKQAKLINNLLPAFSDKRHHLFKLILQTSNDFEIFLDDKSVGKGNLLDDLDPAINPPKEIIDPNDTKPADWDERPQIDDPDAVKPEDWDDEAPKTIEDPSATKPEGWLENESKYIPDPSAVKPEDWEEMDGEWEAPLIENPACAAAPGCGKWKAPMIANPNYKGKWKPAKIDNPRYKGKWSPKMINNPDYYFDDNPFSSLEPIGGVAFELWSMADNLAFDNLVITNEKDQAELLQVLTWQDKKAEADASSPSLITRTMHYLKVYPWLWVVVVLAIALPLFLFISYCCDTKRGGRAQTSRVDAASARRKKADEPRPDDAKLVEELEEEETEEEEEDEEEEEEDEEEEEEADEEETEKTAGDKVPLKQARMRKKN